MFKRIIAMLLLIATLSCLLVPTVSAATTTTITASGEQYPTTLTKGSSFGLRGKYTTNVGSITRVEATVKNSAGTTKYSFTASPNTATFDVNGTKGGNGKTLNATVGFGSLAVGTYTLEIRMHANGSTSPTRTVKKTFSIVSASTSTTPTITASSEQYPTSIKQGSSFGLRGVYTTNVGTITSVSATVKNSAGTTKYSFSASPNVKSFSVNGTKGNNGKTLDSTFAFGSLAAGTYTLQINITAKNGTASKTHTVTRNFTITGTTYTTPTITPSSEQYPTSIKQGSSFALRGVYTTNVGTITSVSATVKNSAGTTKYSFSASPNVKSFNVNGTTGSNGKTLNSTIGFGSLSAGTYTLQIKITAKNGTASKTHTVTKNFTITSTTYTTPTISATSEQYPTSIKQGNSFSIRGVYTTNVGKITEVHATVRNSSGVLQYSFDAYPSTTSFDVNGTTGTNGRTLNSIVAFGSLAAGTYTLKIDITAKNGTASKTYPVSKTFTITSTTNTTPTISASSEQYPTNINYGSSFGLRGIYTTNVGKITSVSATIKTSGGVTKYSFSATPNTTSFNVTGTKGTNGKTLDSTFAFGSLPAGTYTLQINITAKNGTASKTHPVTRTFTIVNASNTTSIKVVNNLKELPKNVLDYFLSLLETGKVRYLTQYNGNYCVHIKYNNTEYYIKESVFFPATNGTDATSFPMETTSLDTSIFYDWDDADESTYHIKRERFGERCTIDILRVDYQITTPGTDAIWLSSTVNVAIRFDYDTTTKCITVYSTTKTSALVKPTLTLRSTDSTKINFDHMYATVIGVKANNNITAGDLISVTYQVVTNGITALKYGKLAALGKALHSIAVFTYQKDTEQSSALYELSGSVGQTLIVNGKPVCKVETTSPIFLRNKGDSYTIKIDADRAVAGLTQYLSASASCTQSIDGSTMIG